MHHLSLHLRYKCESGVSYFTLNIFSFVFPANKNKNKCQKIPTSMHHSMGLILQLWKRDWLVSNSIPLKEIGGRIRGCHWWWQSKYKRGSTMVKHSDEELSVPGEWSWWCRNFCLQRSANISTSCHQMSKNSSKSQLLQLMATRQWAFPFVILATGY